PVMVAASADETARINPNTPRGVSDRMALPLLFVPQDGTLVDSVILSRLRSRRENPRWTTIWQAYHSHCHTATLCLYPPSDGGAACSGPHSPFVPGEVGAGWPFWSVSKSGSPLPGGRPVGLAVPDGSRRLR